MDPSYEVTVEELRRQIDKVAFEELTKYQLVKVARSVTQVSIELVVLVREPDENVRLTKAHRIMLRLIEDIRRLA